MYPNDPPGTAGKSESSERNGYFRGALPELEWLGDRMALGDCPFVDCPEPKGGFKVHIDLHGEEVFECDGCRRNGDSATFQRLMRGDDDLRGGNTDLGNAERFTDQFGGSVRYCHPWGRWLVQTGTHWKPDDSGAVERLMKVTVRAIYHEASSNPDEAERKALADHAKRSESKKRVTDALYLARSEPGIPVTPGDLNRDPWLLNCENGTVDLRTGELREHDPDDLITKIAPVRYIPEAQAPMFEGFLERILPSSSLRRFMQRAVGYAASGAVSEEVLVILYGTGANGKSTLVNAIMDTLGDYAMQAAPELLMVKRGSHPTELADLFGARFVASVEVEEGRRLAESLVKQLTGRDPIKARRMREDFWQFDPTHTVFLATNHKPEVRGTDHAIWRRIKLVPFDVAIPEDEQDKILPDKLRAERPGILAWIVRGCLEYLREGLGEPAEVKTATAGYRSEMDVLAAFFEDRCVEHPKAEVPATPLYEEYRHWCEENGEKWLSQKKFGGRLRERGFEGFTYTSGPHMDRRGWRGIGLRSNRPDGGGDRPGAGNPPDDQGGASANKRDQAAHNTRESRGDRPVPDDRPDDHPGGESSVDIGNSHKTEDRPEDTGPKISINTKNPPHEALMPILGPGSSDHPVTAPRREPLNPEQVELYKRMRAQRVPEEQARKIARGEEPEPE